MVRITLRWLAIELNHLEGVPPCPILRGRKRSPWFLNTYKSWDNMGVLKAVKTHIPESSSQVSNLSGCNFSSGKIPFQEYITLNTQPVCPWTRSLGWSPEIRKWHCAVNGKCLKKHRRGRSMLWTYHVQEMFSRDYGWNSLDRWVSLHLGIEEKYPITPHYARCFINFHRDPCNCLSQSISGFFWTAWVTQRIKV